MMYDKNRIIEHFSEILKYKTVAGDGNQEEFVRFREGIRKMYPKLHRTCEFQLIGQKGMLFHWKGKVHDKSVVLMSHYDVVPADRGDWKYPPFSGTVADAKIWGRGAIDTKCTLCAILEGAEALIGQGFTPQSDVYLCFGGDEETSGNSAVEMAAELKKRDVHPYLILDEGGAVVDGTVVGINHSCALIGIAEKGYMDVEFIARGTGGHSSLAGGGMQNPISIMAEVIQRINGGIFETHISEPLKLMVDTAARHANFKYRMVLRNYRFWGRLLRRYLIKILPEINALTKTVGSITNISGGSAENVIPEQIRAVGNFRIITGSSVKEALNRIQDVLSDLNVEVNLLSGLEPSSVSDISGAGWEILSKSISEIYKDSVMIPYLMLARSDSRSYCDISNNIYRFSPIILTKAERSSIHGVNENITVDNFERVVDFYIHLISSI